jgi:TRAP-type uncharacterized transport system substrate-binding protein
MSRTSMLLLVLLALLWWAAGNLRRAMPPQSVVIQAGPRGGSFDVHAHRYAREMALKDVHVSVRNQDDSLRIIDKVQDATGGVQIGFTAQRVAEQRYPDVASAGVVELQPLFLFLRREQPVPITPASLAGRRIVMPLDGSATAQAARDLLACYHVTSRNASFRFVQMDQAAQALQHGEADGGFFMLDAGNPLVRRLANDPALFAYSFNDNLGIARNIDYLRPTTLARGALDLTGPIPRQALALVGANVDVVVRKDIHPAVLYALLQAMEAEHKGQTLVSDAGEYPRQSGAALPIHPLAEAWRKSGAPWVYTHLPGQLAGVVDAYWGSVLALLTLVSITGTVRSIGRFLDDVAMLAALQCLAWLQRRAARGLPPGRASRRLLRLLDRVIVRRDVEEIALVQLEQLRERFESS